MRIRNCVCPAHALLLCGRGGRVCEECRKAGCTPDLVRKGCPGIARRSPRVRGAVRVRSGPRTFHSKGEARRGTELALAEKAGAIRDLEYQVPFDLVVNGRQIARYIADFRYTRADTGETVVEDYKGHRTETYRLKRALMAACYGIDIHETGPR